MRLSSWTSRVLVGQLNALYNGDRSRKTNLVDYGFWLPSALDNGPLKFEEFERKLRQTVFVSAIPADYERKVDNVVEQVVRPTGLVDPLIMVRPALSQVDDLMSEITDRVKKDERVLVTTLTKRMAEQLTEYLSDHGIKMRYLHSEVSLVAVLDADKEGFLRSERSVIPTIGCAGRNLNGVAILYGGQVTNPTRRAIDETERRRAKQIASNLERGITAVGVKNHSPQAGARNAGGSRGETAKIESMSEKQIGKEIKRLGKLTVDHAKNLEFEKAAQVRDQLHVLKQLAFRGIGGGQRGADVGKII